MNILKKNIPLNKLHPFANNPYKVLDNEEMAELTQSIRELGILSPFIVRPMEDAANEYEIISGHRRFRAAQKAGIEMIPAFIYPVSRDEAAVMVVDSNLHREHILPSEKAFAYKLKMDAISHQGARTDLTSGQVGTKKRSDEIIAEKNEDSARQIQRYIRLTYLIPQLLDMMDQGKIAFSVGVELSYLDEDSQFTVLDFCDWKECTPSFSQASRLHSLSRKGKLNGLEIENILKEEKPNQRETIKISSEKLRSVIPKSYDAKKTEDFIIKACMYYQKYLQRQHNQER